MQLHGPMAATAKVVHAGWLSKKETMDSQVGVFGVEWYMREDYDRSRAMFIDGDALPRSYEEWKQQVEPLRERLVSQGILVVQAYINPDVFPDWCVANGCQPDARGRDMFAASVARRVMVEQGHFRD
jgi:hypothetical protein